MNKQLSGEVALLTPSETGYLYVKSCLCTLISVIFVDVSQSQWPHGLRRGSAAARFLGLTVRVPLGHGCIVS